MNAEPTLIFEALYAEIERLKATDAIKESAIRDLCAIARDKNQLITELCDALKKSHVLFSGDLHDLIQRAREATR